MVEPCNPTIYMSTHTRKNFRATAILITELLDHELVANIQLKLCRQSVEKSSRKRYDVDKLRVYETVQEFRIALSNRFQVLEQTERVEDCWSGVKEAICGASEEVLGFRTHAQPGWMTGRNLEKVSERKAI